MRLAASGAPVTVKGRAVEPVNKAKSYCLDILNMSGFQG
jgi:hypothetical protein